MRQFLALVVVLALIVGVGAPPADAGGSTGTNVALGLASFAVFNQFVGPLLHPRPGHREHEVVVVQPVYREVYVPPAQVVVVRPAPTYPTVVQYANGRYELHGDGIYTPYQWVWIPNAPLLPPMPPPPPGS
jgi:hypothetical protein